MAVSTVGLLFLCIAKNAQKATFRYDKMKKAVENFNFWFFDILKMKISSYNETSVYQQY